MWASFGIALLPGPVEQPAVERRDVVVHEDHVGPLGVEEGGQGLVVGAGRFEGHHDLREPCRPLVVLEAAPEGREARGGVREGHRLLQDPGVGEPDLGHVGGLRHIEPDEEAVPSGPEVRLQFPESLDTLGIVPHCGHGVLPPR